MANSKIVMTTCYDSSFAKICAKTGGIDYLLVGDSMGMVIYGEDNTLGVTLQQMKQHVRAVRLGLQKSGETQLPRIVADMPVHTYDSPEQAVQSAQDLIEAGADMVKVEGPVCEIVTAIDSEGIPVCAHIGLTPQSIQVYKLQGKAPEEAERLFREAKDLQTAGAQLIVFELIPAPLAKEITEALSIPSIGIGAGPDCSGQVLVLYDLLGFDNSFSPKFLKRFAKGQEWTTTALQKYSQEVREGQYPSRETSFY